MCGRVGRVAEPTHTHTHRVYDGVILDAMLKNTVQKSPAQFLFIFRVRKSFHFVCFVKSTGTGCKKLLATIFVVSLILLSIVCRLCLSSVIPLSQSSIYLYSINVHLQHSLDSINLLLESIFFFFLDKFHFISAPQNDCS